MATGSVREKSIRKLGFVLLGKTGIGKSALGNLLLGKKAFQSGLQRSSLTKEPKSDFSNRGNICVTVVDNPGLFSENLPMLTTARVIQDSIKMVGHDNFVFLLVLRFGRFTVEDNDTMDFLTIMFGHNFMQHTIIIFTHEDQVHNDEQNIEDLIQDFISDPKGKELFDRCSETYLTVNCFERNEDIKERKWKTLLEKVMKITDNGKTFYREDCLHVYKDALRTHEQLWTNNRLTAEEMKIIIATQDKEKQKQIEKLERQNEETTKLLQQQNKMIKLMKIAGITFLLCGGVWLAVKAVPKVAEITEKDISKLTIATRTAVRNAIEVYTPQELTNAICTAVRNTLKINLRELATAIGTAVSNAVETNTLQELTNAICTAVCNTLEISLQELATAIGTAVSKAVKANTLQELTNAIFTAVRNILEMKRRELATEIRIAVNNAIKINISQELTNAICTAVCNILEMKLRELATAIKVDPQVLVGGCIICGGAVVRLCGLNKNAGQTADRID